jgi:hypothetical protein
LEEGEAWGKEKARGQRAGLQELKRNTGRFPLGRFPMAVVSCVLTVSPQDHAAHTCIGAEGRVGLGTLVCMEMKNILSETLLLRVS